MSTTQRYAKAESASWAGLWGNMLLALFKGVIGWLSGSKALLADAFRTAAEAVSGIAAISGLRASRQRKMAKSNAAAEAEDTRGEATSTILLSVVLLVIGLEIGISAIRDISDRVTERAALEFGSGNCSLFNRSTAVFSCERSFGRPLLLGGGFDWNKRSDNRQNAGHSGALLF